MFKVSIAALLAIFALVNVSYARGGGAETMPMVNYTDLPNYHPINPFKCIKFACRLRARQESAHNR